MPQEPNAQFDQTVLDLIEHSPVGAVPNTPAYQDALARLQAAHQVYADADHKDGHVTARFLATRPSFHAQNLPAFITGEIGAEALEPDPSIFARYVQSLPPERRVAAESYRERVVGRPSMHRPKHSGTEKLPVAPDPRHTLFLVPGTGPHPSLPGNYLYGTLLQLGAEPASGPWALHLHDADDGAASFEAPTLAPALEKLEDVLASVPFNLNELHALGFSFNY